MASHLAATLLLAMMSLPMAGQAMPDYELSEGRSAIRKMAEKIIDIEAMTSEDCSFSVGVMQRRKMGELRFIKSQC